MMSEQQKLQEIGEAVARIDERTRLMQENWERELRGAHARITEVKQDGERDVTAAEARLCKKVKRQGRNAGGVAGVAGGLLGVALVYLRELLGR